MPKYRIGCSGFLYDSWRGTFYPEEIPQRRWLSFYVQKLNTVELNVTFYRLLKKEAFEMWHRETPPRFSFSLKGSRFITHVKKLKDVELPLLTFFNTTTPLLEKLEVVLWQLPPNFRANLKSLEEFIEVLRQYPVRHVFEFRHNSWINKRVFKLLSASNIAVCMADWPKFIDELPITADFVYIRRHGEVGGYATTNYTTEQLRKDAKRIKNYLRLNKDVYIYFNNDAMGYAPKNAMELQVLLERSLPKALREQITPTKKVKTRKAKPARRVSKKKAKPKRAKPAKRIKKKKPVKKLKPRKVLRRKVAKKTIKKRPVKKLRAKKLRKKKVSKKPLKKPVRKKLKKKPAKKTLKKKTPRRPVRRKTAKKTKVTKKRKR